MKVLIVGLGSIAKKHISSMIKIGIRDIFALRSSFDSPTHPGVKNIFSYEEIIEHNFDFILISNVTSKHEETIKQILIFRKPLFIEKPLFHEITVQNQKLVKKVSSLGIPTYVGCSFRFLDCLIELKNLLKGSRINEVNIYSGSFLPEWRPNVDFRKSYSAKKEMGGGVHIDLIHELDYLFWIFGEPVQTTKIFGSKSSLEIDAVDYANFIWEYKDFNVSVILNYYRRDPKRTVEIVTSEATFLVDLLENKIFENGKEIFSSDQTLIQTLDKQMEYFVGELVKKNREGFNTIKEANKVLKLCIKD